MCLFSVAGASTYPDFHTGKGVGVTETQWDLQAQVAPLVAQGKTTDQALDIIFQDYRTRLGATAVRFNTLFVDEAFELKVYASLKRKWFGVVQAAFDYYPVGIEAFLPAGWWDKLKAEYGEERARFFASQLVAGLPIPEGQEWILAKIRNYKQRYSSYTIGHTLAAGNDCENGIEYVFPRNTYLAADGSVTTDSSSYGGGTLMVSQGTVDGNQRAKIEQTLGTLLPTDATLGLNTGLFWGRMRQAWNVDRWLEGARHGYWDGLIHNGALVIYFGDCGLGAGDFYSEFGVDLETLPGRFDLFDKTPEGARWLFYHPHNTTSRVLYAIPQVATRMKAKSAALAR